MRVRNMLRGEMPISETALEAAFYSSKTPEDIIETVLVYKRDPTLHARVYFSFCLVYEPATDAELDELFPETSLREHYPSEFWDALFEQECPVMVYSPKELVN
jgi:hypothetical protein